MKRTDTKRENPLHGRRKKKAFRKKNFWCSIYKRNEHVFSFLEEDVLCSIRSSQIFKDEGKGSIWKIIFYLWILPHFREGGGRRARDESTSEWYLPESFLFLSHKTFSNSHYWTLDHIYDLNLLNYIYIFYITFLTITTITTDIVKFGELYLHWGILWAHPTFSC